MATYRSVSVPLPEAQRLADLSSIQTDLRRCSDMCGVVAESMLGTALGPVVMDSLATAIPIVYARPFINGVRVRISDVTATFHPDELSFHNSILQMRSKYSAHSVNGMESQQVRVWLNPEERGGRRINKIDIAQSHLAALAPADYNRLASICSKILAWLEVEMAAEYARLLSVVLKRNTIDSLYEMECPKPNQADGLGRAHVGRSRSSL